MTPVSVALLALALLAAACAGTGDTSTAGESDPVAGAGAPVEASEAPRPLAPAPPPHSDGGDGLDADGDVVGEGFVSLSVGAWGQACGLTGSGRLQCSVGEAPAGRFVAVSAAKAVDEDYVCGVRVGGAVECWGEVPEDVAAVPEGVFTAVAAGIEHVCAVDDEGAVVCWGDGFDGTGVAPAGPFAAVSAGYSHTCGIREDGSVACWGAGYAPWYEADASVGEFESVSAGSDDACGIRPGGDVECWASARIESPPDGAFVSVDVGTFFSCGVRAGGAVACWGVGEPRECMGVGLCYGWDSYPGLAPAGPFLDVGVGSAYYFNSFPIQICGLRVSGDIVCWNRGSEVHRPPVGRFVAVDGGEGFVCGVRVGGAGECWGHAPYAWDLGVGFPPLEWAPADDELVSVSAGWGHACGLRPGGQVECWGADLYGETRPPPGVFVEVSAGKRLTCGLRRGGQAACWGANEWWQATPPQGRFTSVAAGDGFACGLRPGRRVECWGRPLGADPPGGLFTSLSLRGHACAVDSVGGLDCWVGGESLQADHPGGAFVSVSARGDYACGLRSDRSVECWGDADRTEVSPDGAFEAVTVGEFHACGVHPGGELECWWRHPSPFGVPLDEPVAGRGDRMSADPYWEHDLRQHAAVPEPVGVPPYLEWVGEEWSDEERVGEDRLALPLVGSRADAGGHLPTPGPFLAIAAGGGEFEGRLRSKERLGFEEFLDHTCALRSDGTVVCWGSDQYKQATPPPERVDAAPYVAVVAGVEHTCALSYTGEVLCWGHNLYGQTSAPPGPFAAITAGDWHTCGLRPNGDAECWGDPPFRHGDSASVFFYADPPPGAPREPPPGPFVTIRARDGYSCAQRPDGEQVCWYSY